MKIGDGSAEGLTHGTSDADALDAALVGGADADVDADVKEGAEVDEPIVDADDDADVDDKDDEPAKDDADDDDKDEKVDKDDDKDKDKADKADKVDDIDVESPVKSLRAHIAKNAELKALLDAEENAPLKGLLFRTARRADRADKYDEIFQTPETAKSTATVAEQMVEFDRLFRSDKPVDAENFLRSLKVNSFERDATGKFVVDKDGAPISDGSYDRVMKVYRTAMYSELDGLARDLQAKDDTKPQGDDLAEALKIVREAFEGPEQQAADSDESKLPEKVRRELAELRRKANGNTNKTPEEVAVAADDAVDKAIGEDADKILKQILDARKTAITAYVRQNILRDVVAAVKTVANQNAIHKSQFSNLLKRTDGSDESLKKVVDFRRSYAKDFLGRTVAKALSNATSTVIKDLKSTTDKRQKQVQQSKEAPVSEGGVNRLTRPDVREKAKVAQAAAKTAGKKLSDNELLDAALR